MKLNPHGDRVVIRLQERKEEKKGGIIIPETATDPSQVGVVVALGTGIRDDTGELIEFNVAIGDTVLIPKFGGTEVTVDGEKLQVIKEDDILGVVG